MRTPPTSPSRGPLQSRSISAVDPALERTPRATTRTRQASQPAKGSENAAPGVPTLRSKRSANFSAAILSPLRRGTTPPAPTSPRRKQTPTVDKTPTAATVAAESKERSARIHSPRFYESLRMRWRQGPAKGGPPAAATDTPMTFTPAEAEPLPSLNVALPLPSRILPPPVPSPVSAPPQSPPQIGALPLPSPTGTLRATDSVWMPVPSPTGSVRLANDVSNAITALHALPSPALPSPSDSAFFRRASSASADGTGAEDDMAGVGARNAAHRAMLKGGNFWEPPTPDQSFGPETGDPLSADDVATAGEIPLTDSEQGSVADHEFLSYLFSSSDDNEEEDDDERPATSSDRTRASPPRLSSAWSSDSPYSDGTPNRSRATSDAPTPGRSRAASDAGCLTASRRPSQPAALPVPDAPTPEMEQDWARKMNEVEKRWSGVLDKKRDSVPVGKRRSADKRSSVLSASRTSAGKVPVRQKVVRSSLPPRLSLPPISPLSTSAARLSAPQPRSADALTTVWESFVSAADVSVTATSPDDSLVKVAPEARRRSLEKKEGEVAEALLMMKRAPPKAVEPEPTVIGLGIEAAGLEELGALVADGVPSLPDLPRSRASRDLSIHSSEDEQPQESLKPDPPQMGPTNLDDGDDGTANLVAAFPAPPSASSAPHRRSRQLSAGQTKSAPLRPSGPQRPAPPKHAPLPMGGPLNPDGRAILSFSSRVDKSARSAAPAPLQLNRGSVTVAPLSPPPTSPLPPSPLLAFAASPALPPIPALSPALPPTPAESPASTEPPTPPLKVLMLASKARTSLTVSHPPVPKEAVNRPARVTSLYRGHPARLNASFPPPSNPVGPVQTEVLPFLPPPKHSPHPSPALASSASTMATSVFSVRSAPDTPPSSVFDEFVFSTVPQPAAKASPEEAEEVIWGMAM